MDIFNKALIIGLNEGKMIDAIGISLRFYGNPNQVKAFLAYCKMMGYSSPEIDWYGWGQLAKIIGNFANRNKKISDRSFAIRSVAHNWRQLRQKPGTLNQRFLNYINPGDNGVYIISNWTIVRRYGGDDMEEMTPRILKKLLGEIDQYQPCHVSKKIIDEFVENNGFYYIG